MKRVFADANYWIAICNKHDMLHQKAKEVSQSLGKVRLVTSEPVLIEVLNGLGGKGEFLRKAVVKLVDQILKNANVEVVPQTTLLFKKAFDRYRNRDDKGWGLTDCASFVIIEEMGLTEVLAKDQHFAQAGFTTLLASN